MGQLIHLYKSQRFALIVVFILSMLVSAGMITIDFKVDSLDLIWTMCAVSTLGVYTPITYVWCRAYSIHNQNTDFWKDAEVALAIRNVNMLLVFSYICVFIIGMCTLLVCFSLLISNRMPYGVVSSYLILGSTPLIVLTHALGHYIRQLESLTGDRTHGVKA